MSLLHPQLAAFSTVLEEGSYWTAARRLNLTFGAMHHAIAEVVASYRLRQNARIVQIAWDGVR